MSDNTYIQPRSGGVATVAQPSPAPALPYILVVTTIAMVGGFLAILLRITGETDIPNIWFYLQLIILITVLAAMKWLKEKSGQNPIILLIIATVVIIIINSISSEANIKSAAKSLSTTVEISLNKGTKNETVDIPDKTTVKFKSNKRFAIIERRGTNPDGTYIMEPVKMPPGKSERYFTWGGNIVLQGLYDETALKISY